MLPPAGLSRFNIRLVRQGSVLSPALFAVYMDDLIVKLRRAGVGCHLGGIFTGVVGYADDLLLMAPSRSAMETMLKICEEYGEQNNLEFSTDPNPSKSKSKCIQAPNRSWSLVTGCRLQITDYRLISKSQNLKISNLKISKSQNLKISNLKILKSQNLRISKSQNLRISKSQISKFKGVDTSASAPACFQVNIDILLLN